MSKNNFSIPIKQEADVRVVSEATSSLAMEIGFERVACAELALAVSEIAQNAWRHGGGGVFEILTLKNGKILQVNISDYGKGIQNIDLAMREGFSTIRTSLGIGLEAAQRSVDKFVVKSSAEGTNIIMQKFLPMRTDVIEYGMVSVPDEKYNFNGDEYLIKEFDGDKVLLGVIDGIGQGYKAHAMAMLIKNFVVKNFHLTLDSLILSCDSLLKESEITGGAAMSLAIIEPKQLTYLGVGDTHCYLLNESPIELLNFEGRVGEYLLPKLETKVYEFENTSTFLMCTDGIKSDLLSYELPMNEAPQKMANFIFNHFHRPYGDVTTLVTKYKI
ncbi:MAG: ATP-binding protein [Saprospiraceae bacterium]